MPAGTPEDLPDGVSEVRVHDVVGRSCSPGTAMTNTCQCKNSDTEQKRERLSAETNVVDCLCLLSWDSHRVHHVPKLPSHSAETMYKATANG
ncbi:hypothetical protein rerp_59300 [Rhodococcus erythropolis]|nr:hypothetical protein rerp_59300 [Rhodococcus erythropolis]